MPPSGAVPKPRGHAVTRYSQVFDWVEVPDVPNVGPALPDRQGEFPWPPGCEAKWAAWAAMPHTRLWRESDWQFAVDTLECAAHAIERGSVSMFAELRTREKIMGTTWDSRRALRLNYVAAKSKSGEPSVTKLDDYRAL